jgi:hypothetical protein
VKPFGVEAARSPHFALFAIGAAFEILQFGGKDAKNLFVQVK